VLIDLIPIAGIANVLFIEKLLKKLSREIDSSINF